jgi:hypothetical protein
MDVLRIFIEITQAGDHHEESHQAPKQMAVFIFVPSHAFVVLASKAEAMPTP